MGLDTFIDVVEAFVEVVSVGLEFVDEVDTLISELMFDLIDLVIDVGAKGGSDGRVLLEFVDDVDALISELTLELIDFGIDVDFGGVVEVSVVELRISVGFGDTLDTIELSLDELAMLVDFCFEDVVGVCEGLRHLGL
jgi:hypothetical protein